ncbi:U3 small nucleolar ribonucleoprotein complex, subunit Mpp10 [Circinella umbellata]|nr:U3 small nucleolar ribonucleoprotein complex, subunit Mpp10 [Circinella umbellata]
MGRTPQHPVKRFVTQVVTKPQVFFTADDKIVDQALVMAKHFYDTAKKNEQIEFSPFPELLTEGFDRDQIWEEIVTQNEPFLNYAKTTVQDFGRKRKHSELELNQEEEEDDDESASGRSMDLDEQEDLEEEEEDEDVFDDNDNEEMEEMEEEEEDLEEEEEENDDDILPPKKKKQSEVDDDFFNLEEFNNWTEKQEELDMMSDREDDDAIDFDNDMNDEEDEDEDEEDLGDVSEMKFQDFFVPEKKRTGLKPKKQVKFANEEDDEDELVLNENEEEDELEDDEQLIDEEDEEEEEEEEEEESEKAARNLFDEDEEQEEDETTEHQKRLERINAQIEQFEQENVQDKHWTLKGEATAKARPLNSLLEEDLEFDHSAKPVPVITQETTNALEDIIKKRILDNQFDDVERKEDPTLRPFLPSKRVDISDERSKRSLAELYEDDYVKQKSGDKTNVKDEALKQEHEDIASMFESLCHKLDSLSNFHFTPKAPKAEMTIVSDAPAISMEEVTPVNVSDATLLAPEEVYEKKQGEIKSKTEMSQEERKRAHAQKKKLKRKEKAMKEREMKLINKMNPGMGHKHAKMKAVKELLGQKNVEIIKNK